MVVILILANLSIGEVFEGYPSQTPDLVEQAAIAPDVTGSGESVVVHGLWRCPFDKDFVQHFTVTDFREFLRLPKGTNLCVVIVQSLGDCMHAWFELHAEKENVLLPSAYTQ